MSTFQLPITPGDGMLGETACGAWIMITSDTPYIYFHDEVVYFCGQDCKQLFEKDPLNSCMANRLLSGK